MIFDRMPQRPQTRWASFENATGAKGAAASANKGWKGSPSASLDAGETVTLLNVEGTGCIRRMWLTLSERSPYMLRALRLDMYWDGAAAPAVSVPLGDFFCVGLGVMVPFENEWFSSPEGRSLNAFVPMPFYEQAVITLTNESDTKVGSLFYDINYVLEERTGESKPYYFHACWNRENPTTLGRDLEVLPFVRGAGLFLGMSVGVAADPAYKGSWWGEGEVKIYMDGDETLPTLAGTGTEDYIGTAWGQGTFSHRYQGCPQWDRETDSGTFYRLHLPDPVYFYENCRVTLQQIGGADKATVRAFRDTGAIFRVITTWSDGELVRLLEDDCSLRWEDERFGPETWVNFQRQDDVSATAYFYLDAPTNGLPPLSGADARVRGMKK